MRTSYTMTPKAPPRGAGFQPAQKKKEGLDFGALAADRVASAPKAAQQAAAAQPPKQYPNPEWQPQKAIQTPQPKPPPGGVQPGAQKVAPAAPVEAKQKALDLFGAKLGAKAKTTPEMAGPKAPPQYGQGPVSGSRSGGAGYGNIGEDASGRAQNAGSTGAKAEPKQPSRWLSKSENPGPGYYWDSEKNTWQPTPAELLPAGVSLDDTGWTYTEKDGWTYAPKDASVSALDKEVAAALKGSPEDYGMSPELLAKAKQSILGQGAQAKTDISQQLAGRGLGASGLVGSGFAGVDVGTQQALTDLDVQNWQAGVDARINELKTLLTAQGNQMSEANRKAIADQIADLDKAKFDYEKEQQAEADLWTASNNVLALTGAEAWGAGAWAFFMDMISSGVPAEEAAKSLIVGKDTSTGLQTLSIDPRKAPPPPNWEGTEAEWRSLTPQQMSDAYVAWMAEQSYDSYDWDTNYGGFTPGTEPA